MGKSFWPLMENNINRKDLDCLINYLQQTEPRLTHGPKVIEFEKEWSEWLGVEKSVFVNSGSSANDLTLLALKYLIGEGEVILPPLTWVSDVSSVIRSGFKPIFVDINFNNLAMNPDQIEKKITKKTKAIFLTHILGLNGVNDKIIELANSKGIKLIEDVCESHGATYKEKKLGSFGWASNFSFYYAHHMTTIEGGMICTKDEELYETIRMLRSHGLVREISDAKKKSILIKENPDLNPEFIFQYASHNMRPTELQAIIGLSQIKRLDQNIEIRKRNFEYFIKNLDKDKFYTDFDLEGNSNYAFIILLRKKNKILSSKLEIALKKNGIEFRRGLSGGGNQLRQPYIHKYLNKNRLKDFSNVEHVHFFGWYVGNHPDINIKKIDKLLSILNTI